jgi:hypothetical protein
MQNVAKAVVAVTESAPIFSEVQLSHERRNGESTTEVLLHGEPVATFLFNKDTQEWYCGAQEGNVTLNERRIEELRRHIQRQYPNG